MNLGTGLKTLAVAVPMSIIPMKSLAQSAQASHIENNQTTTLPAKKLSDAEKYFKQTLDQLLNNGCQTREDLINRRDVQLGNLRLTKSEHRLHHTFDLYHVDQYKTNSRNTYRAWFSLISFKISKATGNLEEVSFEGAKDVNQFGYDYTILNRGNAPAEILQNSDTSYQQTHAGNISLKDFKKLEARLKQMIKISKY